MDVYLNSPGNLEVSLKYKELFYGYASDIVYTSEDLLISEYWSTTLIPTYISKNRRIINLFQNIGKDTEQTLILDYSSAGHSAKIHPINLVKYKTPIILNLKYFYAATHGVKFFEITYKSLLESLVRVRNVMVEGNGMFFILTGSDTAFSEILLNEGEDVILNKDNIIGLTKSISVHNIGSHQSKKVSEYRGPGTIFLNK